MTTIAVVYHSGYGHTRRQAEAVAEGVSAAGATPLLLGVEEAMARWGDLETVDGIIFGAPTYMGSVSAKFKEFMDASSKAWVSRSWQDKLAAGFTNSSSQSGDKLASLQQLAVFAAQHGMLWVSLGLMPGNNSSKGSVEDLNRLGSFLGAMAQSDSDAGPDVAPGKADLATARHLGQRVAKLAIERPAVKKAA